MAQALLSTEYGGFGYGLPSGRLENLHARATPQGPGKYALIARPSLRTYREDGDGPIRLIVKALGATYVVSGAELYRNGTKIADLSPGGFVQAAQSDTQLVIVAGWKAYAIQASTVAEIGDIPMVSGVVYLAGRFVYIVRNSGQFYWSAVGSAASIDGTAFAIAESSPDATIRAEILADAIMFGGETTCEWWTPSDDPDLPYYRSPGQRYSKGVLAAYSVIQADNSLFWVGIEEEQGPMVYRTGAQPIRVSTAAIETALSRCLQPEKCTAFRSVRDGVTFYVLNIPEVGSFAYDVGEGKWSRWTSKGRDTFRIACGGYGLFGDDTTGQIWTLDGEVETDGDDEIIRIASAYVPMPSGVTRLSNISLLTVKGVGLATGQGSDPVVDMRYSTAPDGDWSDWMSASLGRVGDRKIKSTWWGLGLIESPGLFMEFRVSDPVNFTPFGVMFNEPRP